MITSPEVAYAGPVLTISTAGWNRFVLHCELSLTEKVELPTTGAVAATGLQITDAVLRNGSAAPAGMVNAWVEVSLAPDARVTVLLKPIVVSLIVQDRSRRPASVGGVVVELDRVRHAVADFAQRVARLGQLDLRPVAVHVHLGGVGLTGLVDLRGVVQAGS